MIAKITKAMVDQEIVTLVALFNYSADASDLGFTPGQVPAQLETELGNGLPFIYQNHDADGSVLYAQDFGCVYLRVFND